MSEYGPRVNLVERSGKLGLGTAYIAGFKWALEHGYDQIFEMDCDFSHNPDDLLRLSARLENDADVVVGSRYVKGMNVVNWPLSRILISYGASLYVRIVTGMPVADSTAGFVGYRREVLERINLDGVRMIGYGFQIEMKYTAWKHGFRIREESIIFTDRELGTSKMSSSIFGEAFFGVLKLPFRKIK
jgi:dolichol-phosphate mannosyltransferase